MNTATALLCGYTIVCSLLVLFQCVYEVFKRYEEDGWND